MKKNKKKVRKRNTKKILLIAVGVLLVTTITLAAITIKVYQDVKGAVNNTYEKVERYNDIQRKVDFKEKKAFSVLLLGVDTGSLGRNEKGRSDTMMVAAVNPTQQKTMLVSLPRDTYAEIVGYAIEDKINHAYAFGGAAMSMDTVEKLLDIPINHYITINMQGIEELVDVVGGIEVDNPFEFTYEKTKFPKGKQHLDGGLALKYSRMRYDDPDGDYGRQNRQRQIITGLSKQMISINSVGNYQQILAAMGENVKTDLTFDEMIILAGDYRSAFGHFETDQLKGEGFMKDEISYQQITPEELTRVQQSLKKQLGTESEQ